MLLVLVFVNVILESEGWVGPIPGSQSNGGKKKARFLRAASNTICPLAKSLGCEGLRQKINEESILLAVFVIVKLIVETESFLLGEGIQSVLLVCCVSYILQHCFPS